jgi:UDP-N-acetylmuramoylalanine--D-glutamate ligase
MSLQKEVLVYGAGISGCGAAEELQSQGRKVILYDDKERELAPSFAQKEFLAKGGKITFGNIEQLLPNIDLMVISPGVPIDSKYVLEAQAKGIEVISEIELAYRNYPGKMAAITGTNGKTTTTSIVGEMFKTLPVKTAVGGNIGLALSKEIKGLTKDSWIAAEISSFQLEGVKEFKPQVAAVLNLTPDHIERHHTMEVYGQVKQHIFAKQTAENYTVLNYDDPEVRTWAKLTHGTVCFFSRVKKLEQGIYMEDGNFIISWNGKKEVVCNKDELLIFGGHNEENVLAAIACGYFAGVTVANMRKVLMSFKSLEHRIEFVTEIDGVPYYNDSKATNPDSTIKALAAFPKGHIILLAGGHDKMTELEPMMKLIKETTDILILLGEAKERFHKAALAAGIKNIVLVDSFKEAVDKAHELAHKPQVVLLSPACSSYDMFHNYPERGRTFKKMVMDLKK